MKTRYLAVFLLGFFHIYLAFAQISTPNRDDFRLHIFETEEKIEIDGLLNESVWDEADVAKNFARILPVDTGYAISQSEVRMTYDQQNLYIAIIFFDTIPGRRPVESLRRDFSFGRNDNFLSFIDTYNDQTNGFSFGISAAGAQWEGLQANGGFVNLSWDCKWYSAVKNFPDRWVAEFAIPFRSIRYKEGVTEWGINFSRLDLKTAEKSSWAPVPRQFQSANLAYAGALVWDKPPPDLGTRFSFIPYVLGRSNRNIEAGEEAEFGGKVGADAKITLSTSMNLDLTLNPDFSQVEVDRQVTNLDRFELFFPERRQFFLENSDLFSSLGSENIRPFFSRRIGLGNDVRAGARLSGKLGQKWRIGLMNMQTAGEEGISSGKNYTVGVLQRQVLKRSFMSFFLVNQEFTGRDPLYDGIGYNRVAGADFNLASADDKWTGKFFYHQVFNNSNVDKDFTLSGKLAYNTQNLSISWEQAYVGANYLALTGFVRRRGINTFNPKISYKFFPASSFIANHGPVLELQNFYRPDFSLTDREVELGYRFQFLDRSSFVVELEDTYLQLLDAFDPTNTGGEELEAGSEHRWQELSLTYQSNARALFNIILDARYGGYFNGERLGLTSVLNYRVQPYGSLGLTFAYNKISLPEPYTSANLVLIGPRLDLTFTNTLFLTTFVQYNNQIDNLNVNMRFQWRFAPVSDLFIVYTDNSYPDGLRSKNRALVAKLSYWFN